MDRIQEQIEELEIVINSLTNNSINENTITRFVTIKVFTVEEMKEELARIKEEYEKIQSLKTAYAVDIKNNIISRIADLEFYVNLYIENGELSRVIIEEFKLMIENIEKVTAKSENALSEKEEKLKDTIVRYHRIVKYAKATSQNVDRMEIETAIAGLILSIIIEKTKEGIKIDLRKEIPEEFAHEVVLLIQKEINEEKERTEPQKNLIEAMKKKLQLNILENRKDRNWNVSKMAYDETLIGMYGILEGNPKEIESKLREYYNPQEKEQETEKETSEEISRAERLANEEEKGINSKTALEVYKELKGIETKEQIDFEEYRAKKIAEWQIITGAAASIAPKPDQITIITDTMKVRKMSIEEFYKRLENDNKENYELTFSQKIKRRFEKKPFRSKIRAIIIGTNIKSIAGFTDDCSTMENLEEIVLNEGLQEIVGRVFKGSGIKELICPPTLKTIGNSAFKGCTNLTKVQLNEGLQEIVGGAFEESGIKELICPSTLKTIGEFAFIECANLTKVQLNEGLQKIGWRAFEESGIKELICPSTLKRIDHGVFANCANLTKVQLNEGLQEIGKTAFGKTGIKELICPSTLKTIGISAFNGCTNLTKVQLNEGLQEIDWHAFEGSGIKELICPSTLETMGDLAFAACTNLTKVQLNEGLSRINYGTFERSGIKELICPSTLQVIGSSAFWGCANLTKVQLNEGLREISWQAFERSGIKELICPSTLKIIGEFAFESCANLTKVQLNEGLQKNGGLALKRSGITFATIKEAVQAAKNRDTMDMSR